MRPRQNWWQAWEILEHHDPIRTTAILRHPPDDPDLSTTLSRRFDRFLDLISWPASRDGAVVEMHIRRTPALDVRTQLGEAGVRRLMETPTAALDDPFWPVRRRYRVIDRNWRRMKWWWIVPLDIHGRLCNWPAVAFVGRPKIMGRPVERDLDRALDIAGWLVGQPFAPPPKAKFLVHSSTRAETMRVFGGPAVRAARANPSLDTLSRPSAFRDFRFDDAPGR